MPVDFVQGSWPCGHVATDVAVPCPFCLQSKLVSSEKALRALSHALGNPALDFDADTKSMEEAMIDAAILRIENYKDGWNATDDAWGKEVAELESRLGEIAARADAAVTRSDCTCGYCEALRWISNCARGVEKPLLIDCARCGKSLPSVAAWHGDDESICGECLEKESVPTNWAGPTELEVGPYDEVYEKGLKWLDENG